MSPPPTRPRTRRRGEDGQAVVELALVLPVLLLVLFAILRFGLLFYSYIDLTSATRDAARKVAVSRQSGMTAAEARAAVAAGTTVVDDLKTTVTVTPAAPWAAGKDVTVKVTYAYKLDVLGVVLWSGPMTATSIARVE